MISVFAKPLFQTQTPTPTNSVTPTSSPTPTFVATETPTQTVVPTETPTLTLTSSVTQSVTPTETIVPTETPTLTPTQTVTPTETIVPTETPTLTLTQSVTPTETIVPTETPTLTPTQTLTQSVTPTETIISTETPTLTPTQTVTQTPTLSLTQTLTETPTNTPSNTPTLSVTQTPTPTLTTTTYMPSFTVRNIHGSLIINQVVYGQNQSPTFTSGGFPLLPSEVATNNTTNFSPNSSWDSTNTTIGILMSGTGNGILYVFFNGCVVYYRNVNGATNISVGFPPTCNGQGVSLLPNTEVDIVVSNNPDPYATPTPTPTLSLTSTPTLTPTSTPTLTPTSTPIGTGTTIVHLDGSSASNFLDNSGNVLTTTGNFRTWQDISGYNNNAVGNSFGYYQDNVRNSLGSVGNPNPLTSSFYYVDITGVTETTTTGWTFSTIVTTTNNNSDFGLVQTLTTGFAEGNYGGTLRFNSGRFRIGVGNILFSSQNVFGVGVSNTWLVSVRFDGTKSTNSERLKLWVNGISQPIDFSTNNAPSSDLTISRFRLLYNSVVGYLNGYLHEYLYDNAPLTDQEIQNRNSALLSKWSFFPTQTVSVTPTSTPTTSRTSTPTPTLTKTVTQTVTSTITPTLTPSETPTSDLIMHYDASVSTNFVGPTNDFTRWTDISGYDNHLLPSTTGQWSADTLNSLGAVNIPKIISPGVTINYYLFNGNIRGGSSESNGHTSLALIRKTDVSNADYPIAGNLYVQGGVLAAAIGGTGFIPLTLINISQGSVGLFALRFDGTQTTVSNRLKLWINGSVVPPYDPEWFIPTSDSTTQFSLGVKGSNYLGGQIFEFKRYKTALSDLQIENEINALLNKWAFTPALTPSATPTVTPTPTPTI